MKKNSVTSLFDNNRFLQLLSIFIAVVLWLIAKNAYGGNDTRLVKDVPVQISLEDSILGKLGLDTIIDKEHKVDVLIKGKSYIIGNIEADDIEVNAMLNNITGPGNYEVKLEGRDKNEVGFTVELIRPSVVKLQFDRMVSKKLPLEADIVGVSIPEGYVLEPEMISPREVTITGPEIDILKVYRAVVKTEVNKTLEKTEVFKSKIELQDKDGNVVESKYINLDTTSADVSITVLKKKLVPMAISFINIPQGFPIGELEYEFSNDYIEVAGPANVIDNMSEIHLGYVDINSLDIDSAYAFDVSLPVGFENLESVETVVVNFNTEGMIAKKFNVPNIRVVNTPVNYEVKVTTKNISNVTIIGPKEIVDSITSKDIVAEIDMSAIGEIKTGQVKVPVSIFAPNKGLVWANGAYQAVIEIKEK